MASSDLPSSSSADMNLFQRYLNVHTIAVWTNLDNLAMFSEDLRLATFANWSTNRTLPCELAIRGYYYRNRVGTVICAFCGKTFDGWKSLNELTTDHSKESPSCAGVHGKHNGNVPLYNPNQMGWRVKSPTDEKGSVSRRILVRSPPNTLLIKAKPSCFRNEMNRADSFYQNGWTLSTPNLAEMAKNGFYMTSTKLVRCAYCTIKIRKWNLESIPPQKHLQKSSGCPFVVNKDLCENEPVIPDSEPKMDFEEMTTGVNLVTRKDEQNLRSIQDVKEIMLGDMGNNGEFLDYKLIPPEVPVNLHMSIASIRLLTYQSAGKLNIEPDKLVEAGFYYVGPGDFVRCFACNGGFYGWVKNEDVWERHAGFYPECLHVNHIKDKAYVDEQLSKFNVGPANKVSKRDRRVRGKLFTCRNCLKPADLMFTKCGHISSCMNCHEDLTVCPQCQSRTDNRVQVFF